MKLKHAVGSVLFLALATGTWGKEWECKGVHQGVGHRLVVAEEQGKVQSVMLFTVNDNPGNTTCEVSAERGDGSQWIDGSAGGVHVRLPVPNRASTDDRLMLSLDAPRASFILQIGAGRKFYEEPDELTRELCGMNGWMHTRVQLRKGHKQCVFLPLNAEPRASSTVPTPGKSASAP